MNSRVITAGVGVLAAAAIALGAVGCSGKPSKEAVIDGWIKAAQEQGELTESQSEANKAFITCLVDEAYRSVSSDTLKKIADGEINSESLDSVSAEDNQAFTDALAACSAKLTGS